MGATYTRQSTFTDGDVIDSDIFNNEFDQLLAAFASSTGHTHDGTAGEGGPITGLITDGIVFGTNTGDITLTWNGGSNDGLITWKEDEDYFEFNDDLLIATTEKIQFRDTGIYINSSADGQLDLVADTEIQIAATTIDINGNVNVSGTLTIGSAGISEAELEILDGATVTTDELNILDGVTATATELNILDGVTATTAELNILDGKAFLDEDNLASDSATGIASQQSIKAYVDGLTTTSITATGALNSGSITSGFGNIDNGSSTITTTGAITGGSFVIGSADINENDLESIDGITAGTVAASKAVVVDANKDATGFRNITLTGELDAGSLDVSGNVDVDGTLETDALSINGTAVTSTATELNILDGVTSTTAELNILDGVTSTAAELNILDGKAFLDEDNFASNSATGIASQQSIKAYVDGITATNITSTGALNSGSITSGFGNIDTGSSTITTTGLISGGSLDIDNVLINGTTIGHTDDTDLITLANGVVTVAGEVSMTTLDIGGTNVTSTAAELNILDGVTSTAAELNILDGVTSTAAELNILDGVTSTAAELNILDGVTATTAELNILDASNSTIGDLTEISTVANDDVFLAIDTSGGGLKKVTRSTIVSGLATSSGISNVVEDTSPQLGGNLDVLARSITTSTTNGNIALTPNGTGVVMIDGNVGIDTGKIDLKNGGTASQILFYCESSNAHAQTLQGAPHSQGATNTLLLPDGGNGTLLSTVSVATLTNKTLTSPKINEDVAVTSTATELNLLDGVTATTAELNALDGITAVVGELNALDLGSTAVGTAIASKAVVLDANKDYTGIRNFSITGNLSVGGTTTVVDTVTMNAQNAVLFEGATADAHETTLTIVDPTADRTISLPNQSGTVPVLAAASNTAITSTPEELNILDGVTSTAAELNILDGVTSTAAELNILDGVTSTAAELNILDGVTSTAAELNVLDGITAVVGELNALDIGSTAVGTAVASKAVILDSNKDYTGVRNFTLSGELDAGSLDISGNADIDGTLEADAITVNGTALAEVISDTVGAMVSSNTESGITVTYQDADNTLDFAVGTLNQNTTGSAATLTTARAIAVAGDVTGTANFDGSAGISITTTLATNAIVTANITDGNVTVAKMAANSIDSAQYVDGSIDREHLAADIIDGTKIANDAINSEHYAAGSIDNEHIADNAINSEHYADGSIDRAHLAADIIDGTKIANDAINSEHYAAGSIDAEHLASDSVTEAKMAANSVDSQAYVDGSIDQVHLANAIVNEAKLQVSNNPTNGYYLSAQSGNTGGLTWAAAEGVPQGVIVMWSGQTSAIPSGWALCDGNNSTPNLTDRFVMGAGASNETTTGGTNSFTLSVDNLPSHTHTISSIGSLAYPQNSGNQGNQSGYGRGSTLTTNATGSGTAFDNRPAYMALAYIMKT